MILAGDIGGTNTLLALFELQGGVSVPIKEKKLLSQELHCLEETVKDFLEEGSINLDKGEVKAACFGVAAPLYSRTVHFSNLDLTLDIKKIQHNLRSIPSIKFCNDLEALGHGLLTAKRPDLFCLYPGFSPIGKPRLSQAIIASGTGLGEALILDGRHVYTTEGGHADFAPQSEEEIGLWRFLQQQFSHVSYERILSGPGLTNIYRFLAEKTTANEGRAPVPSPAEITQLALDGTCSICQHALDIFIRILGAEAGNLALKSLALGGVYLGGGIPPKILPRLQEKTFLEAFRNKGRFADLLKRIPIYVILNEKMPLHGAALLAAKMI